MREGEIEFNFKINSDVRHQTLPSKGFDELKYYSQIFNTVEANSTFYRPATQTMTKK
jgi:uncharacterized protein YecE (DUF72 family)